MRKSTLEGNILPKAKQRFIVDGYSTFDIMLITRDVLNHEIGVIELPDQTKVPGGRRRAGEFNVSFQFGRDDDRRLFQEWAGLSIDITRGLNTGISSDYKKDCLIVYHRLLSNRGFDSTNGNLSLNPVKVRIIGCWVSSYEFPDYDMNGDEGDGFSTCQATLQYDDVISDFYRNIDDLNGQTSAGDGSGFTTGRNNIGGNFVNSTATAE